MQRNQIGLEKRTIEENSNFLRELYGNNELVNTRIWFDKLDDSSFSRQLDNEMTLDYFLDLMKEDYRAVLQIGSPCAGEIRYCAEVPSKSVDRFLWLECPFTEQNYNVVARLFNQIFKQDIDSVEFAKGLRES